MDKFSITQALPTYGEKQKIAERILADLPKSSLFTCSAEQLCISTLNYFEFPDTTTVADDIAGTEERCKIVLQLMGIDEIDEEMAFASEEKASSIFKNFLYYFFDFTGLPGYYKQQLLDMAEKDLADTEARIAEFIKIDFIAEGKRPRNHTERTQKDFYDRSIDERQKIEDYIKDGITERALEKAKKLNIYGGAEMFFEDYWDSPYHSSTAYAKEYFDTAKINEVRHRLLQVPLKKGRELKQVYERDKEAFYEELSTYLTDEQILGEIQSRLNFIPYPTQERKHVFDELAKLYRSQSWYGFYALGLPQVEGLFSEMAKLCAPGGMSSTAALPDKVKAVRPYCSYAELGFDYFQYRFPNQRNGFSHSGLAPHGKIKIMCKDLLYDLLEVVSIYSNLNIEANQLLRLIRSERDKELLTIQGVSTYLKLLGTKKAERQISSFKEEIESFNNASMPSIFHDIFFDLHERIEEVYRRAIETIHTQSAAHGYSVDLDSMTPGEISKNGASIKVVLEDVINWQLKSEIEELMNVASILRTYKNHLEENLFDPETRQRIQHIIDKHSTMFTKMKVLAGVTGFED